MKTRFSLGHTVLALGIILMGFMAYLYLQPIPPAEPVKKPILTAKTQASPLAWPAGGHAAIGASGYGLLSSSNDSAPVPIASIAKIITAMAVLQKKPIQAGEAEPSITFDQADVALYQDYLAKGGSVAPVAAGEQLSESQALEAMLLPSANNVADSLARWAFGSVQDYTVYANNMVKTMGLKNMTVGDASGFGDSTVSTASDLVKLANAAMDQPAIASAVSKTSDQLPVTGVLTNTNWLLGRDGVVGVKTGHTDKAGGCYLFASRQNISGRQITLIGALLSQPDLETAIGSSPALINSAVNNFEAETLVHKGQELAVYKTAWGASARAVASKDVNILAWKGHDLKVMNRAQPVKAPAVIASKAGDLAASFGQESSSSDLVLSSNLPGPSWHWRLVRR